MLADKNDFEGAPVHSAELEANNCSFRSSNGLSYMNQRFSEKTDAIDGE
jgi:hypothetical protein